MCARHGHWLEGERPLRRLIAPTVSGRQGRRREAGSEGSRRQNCDLRDTNPIRGCEAGRVGKQQQSPMRSRAKAVNGAGVQGKWQASLHVLTRGDLGCVPRGTERTERCFERGPEVSRGHISRWSHDHPRRVGKPAYRAKGQTSNGRSTLSSSGGEHRRQTSPDRGPGGGARAVKPPGPGLRAERPPTRDKGKASAG